MFLGQFLLSNFYQSFKAGCWVHVFPPCRLAGYKERGDWFSFWKWWLTSSTLIVEGSEGHKTFNLVDDFLLVSEEETSYFSGERLHCEANTRLICPRPSVCVLLPISQGSCVPPLAQPAMRENGKALAELLRCLGCKLRFYKVSRIKMSI